jgi:hypothetical protein
MTAEEFFFDYSIDYEYDNLSVNCKQEITYKAIEFAKYHVEQALKAASEEFNSKTYSEFVLDSYPLTNIK